MGRSSMSRKVEEWIAEHDDQAIPTRVKLRIWEREEGRCWISGRKIMPGDLFDYDHKVALINGGEHRESNLFPALRDKHREKTKEDVAEKAAHNKAHAKRLGIDKPKYPPMPGTKRSGLKRGFDGIVRKR